MKQAKAARADKANEARGGADTGKIVTLMSVDAQRVSAVPSLVHLFVLMTYTSPLYLDRYGRHDDTYGVCRSIGNHTGNSFPLPAPWMVRICRLCGDIRLMAH